MPSVKKETPAHAHHMVFVRLCEWLDTRPESDSHVAGALGVSRSTVSKWRTAASSAKAARWASVPSGSVLLKIGKAPYGVSANWLLFGYGPMIAYESVAQGDIQAQLAQVLANRLNHEHADELAKYGTRAISDVEQSPGLLVDAQAALDHAYRAVVDEFRGALFALDVQSTKHEAIRQAQHAAVHGTKLRPLVEHESFRRVVAHAEQAASSDRQTLRFVLRRG